MFYVYGWNSFKIRTKRPQDIRCFECDKIGQMNVNKYVNYAHIFWIPFFPFRIVNEFECVHCRTSINYNEMGVELKRIYGPYKSSVPPIWSFSGIILIAAIILWGWYSNLPDKDRMISIVNAPKENTVFDFKTEDGEYSSFRVCSFDEDYLYIVYNQFQVSNIKDLDRVSEPNFFTQDTLVVDRETLLNEIESGIIRDVHW